MTAERLGRGVIFPADFFLRVPVRKAIRQWPRAVEWYLSLVVVAREACNDGRLESGGAALDLEDLCEIHFNEIDHSFIRHCLLTGLLERDADGCMYIPKWDHWHRERRFPPSRERAAERERSAKRRSKTGEKVDSADPHESSVSEKRPEKTVSKTEKPDPVFCATVEDRSHQPEPEPETNLNLKDTKPDPDTEPETNLNDQPNNQPTETEPDLLPSVAGGRDFSRIVLLGECHLKLLAPREAYGPSKRADIDDLLKSTNRGVFLGSDFEDAMEYALQATQHEMKSPRETPVKSPWKYYVRIATAAIDLARDHRIAQEFAVKHGLPAQEFKFSASVSGGES